MKWNISGAPGGRALPVFVGVLFVTLSASAALRLGSPFGDGMVLQRDRPVPVWGEADPGVRVTVAFAGTSVETTAGADGRWRADLPAQAASAVPRALTVTAAGAEREAERTTVADVLVGEVWLASGQSNMQFRFTNSNPRSKERNGSLLAQITDRPTIRYARVKTATADAPQTRGEVEWKAFTPKFLAHGAPSPSAVATYFALDLEAALRVPVGIVGCSLGGTCIDAWIAHDAASARTAHFARKPTCRPGVLYNGMVAPLAPFAFRGILWYQGEADTDEPEKYADRLARLRADWGRAFENPNCPFLFVQLAPYDYADNRPPRDFVAFQLVQAAYAAAATNAFMAVSNDAGNLFDIHPNDKRPIGLRLAALALRHVYGRTSVEADAPRAVKAVRRADGRVALSFEHGKGLYVYNENRSLAIGLELAGADGVFRPARFVDIEKTGQVKGEPVIAADGVTEPRRVRYLFAKPWYGALRNASGIPAGPFELEVETP